MGNCLKRKKQPAQDLSEEDHKIVEKQQSNSSDPPAKPLKSWEIRRMQQKNKDDFVCKDKQNETIIKEPGSLNGLQYKIESCQNCEIYILDHSTTIFVDDCVNCNIFIGPCKASVFVRDCKQCSMTIACQQYRSRDCSDIKTLLYCQSQPVIESCKNMQFGCFYFAYPQLSQQFKDCGLPPWTNCWSDFYDFTKNKDGTLNYSYLPETEIEIVPFACEKLNTLCSREFCVSKQNLSVPITLGLRASQQDLNNSHVIMLYPEVVSQKSDSLISIFNQRKDIQIIRTLSCKLESDSRFDILFNSTERENLNNEHDFSQNIIFIQLIGKDVEQSLKQIFQDSTTYQQPYHLWNKNTTNALPKICKIIFENWEDERTLN